MKLLFDQNISYKVVRFVENLFPNSQQVRMLGLENTPDIKIWEYAQKNNFIIVTFDADFADIANIKGCPPKIIWLRLGNTTTKKIAEIIKKHTVVIQEFVKNKDYKEIPCIEIE